MSHVFEKAYVNQRWSTFLYLVELSRKFVPQHESCVAVTQTTWARSQMVVLW